MAPGMLSDLSSEAVDGDFLVATAQGRKGSEYEYLNIVGFFAQKA
jgi:hypothetical protein